MAREGATQIKTGDQPRYEASTLSQSNRPATLDYRITNVRQERPADSGMRRARRT